MLEGGYDDSLVGIELYLCKAYQIKGEKDKAAKFAEKWQIKCLYYDAPYLINPQFNDEDASEAVKTFNAVTIPEATKKWMSSH